MADEQYRWLDRETAERLLSGESLEAVDPAAREQAERLAKTLGALSPPPTPSPLTSEELPGEAAALAAFRKARAERGDVEATAGRRSGGRAFEPGLVRIGGSSGAAPRSRWGRPARLGLAAALAVGMVGGVAVAAGTGVLPAPFGGEEPEPAASVSVAVTPSEPPLVSPSPHDSAQGEPRPGGSPDGPSSGIAGGSGRDEPSGGATTKPGNGGGDHGSSSGDRAKGLASACRDLRDGKDLDAGRKRALDRAAGGPSRIGTYCEGVLAAADGGSADGEAPSTSGGDNGAGTGGGRGNQGEQGGKAGDGEGHSGRGRGHRDGALAPATQPEPALPKNATTLTETSPSPTYSAL
ncbi:hypothetical protein [Streptomyces bullii]|uniref:Extensin n=1 Tax=Streptomyces bullii TaxID=349910 RepID=A0ABW0USG4_9ACTN